VRYGTYLFALPASVILALQYPPGWLAVLGVLGALAYSPVRRVWPALAGVPWRARIAGIFLAVFLRIAGDLAKMVGYPVGVVWRWKHAPATQWSKRQW